MVGVAIVFLQSSESVLLIGVWGVRAKRAAVLSDKSPKKQAAGCSF
jgi:hypothetical protein